MQYPGFNEIECGNADELWDMLSPTKELAKKPYDFIYRGHGDATWRLIPSILRKNYFNPAIILWGEDRKADEQVFIEIKLLEIFAHYCDCVGIKLPNDSLEFRETILNAQRADRYFLNPSLWPNPALIEMMALAQHHRVPTRLLDWTKIPYVAAYFAASSAIHNSVLWDTTEELAIWALNTELISLYKNIKIYRVPGALSPNLSAQSGRFSVQFHQLYRGQRVQVIGLEEEFSNRPDTPLIKLTIPIKESLRLLELCDKSGFSAATMYPSAYGAGLAVMDRINVMVRELRAKRSL